MKKKKKTIFEICSVLSVKCMSEIILHFNVQESIVKNVIR